VINKACPAGWMWGGRRRWKLTAVQWRQGRSVLRKSPSAGRSAHAIGLLSWHCLLELSSSNAAEYLSSRWGYDPAALSVRPLGGGVSNTVLLVETPGQRFVLKQALGKLQVEQDWFSDRERIFRESAGIQVLAPHLPNGSVPGIVFEDRQNRLFAMTAAPEGAQTWKSLLMNGAAVDAVARRIAAIQAVMIRISHENTALAEAFGDQTVFGQLRLDPYYRTTALRHPDLKPFFDSLAGEYPDRRISLVHGDWSPKNFLVDGDEVMAIDFEVIHFGDPAFDCAFLLNHLLLKSFHLPARAAELAHLAGVYWRELTRDLPVDTAQLEFRTLRHLGGLLMARIDGKSPAEYLKEEAVRQQVREAARHLILNSPPSIKEVFRRGKR